jgi:ribA/ribD-fused uncharacterized protein
MELPTDVIQQLDLARRDPKAEFECKVLAGSIQTKDVADRLLQAIRTITVGPPKETHLLRVLYQDDIRVEIEGLANIQRVCATNSFQGIPLDVQRKTGYHARMQSSGKDTIDVPDYRTRCTLRFEESIRKDWDLSPSDPRVRLVRLLSRKSFRSADGVFQIDLSMVKSRRTKQQSLRDLLQELPTYELELEWIRQESETSSDVWKRSLEGSITKLLQAYQESLHILPESDQIRYREEFRLTGMSFVNPVTLERRHLRADRPHSILQGYTVTNKADGERSILYVARDRRVLRINKNASHIVWTGIQALTDAHIGDCMDGEYLPELNLFCIFDVYRYQSRDTQGLPLFQQEGGLTSRLGCAHAFSNDVATDFVMTPSERPFRIETKLFLAGDGPAMEEAIRTLLDQTFEYQTDGLIFTPRSSPVAPPAERRGNTWLYVYKWKPPHQNSIDFLVRFVGDPTFDPVLNTRVRVGELYVTRSPRNDIVYPCETLTGEYVPPPVPTELMQTSHTSVPSLFQPSTPRNPDAYRIYIPVNEQGIPHDELGQRIDSHTIIECSYDVERARWIPMRTRYEKTYEYRVLQRPQYGNYIDTAESIWTSIHIPVSEPMIRSLTTMPIDDTAEDETYYRDSDERHTRVLRDAIQFHNQVVKSELYERATHAGDTLLELAVGRSGDLVRWKKRGLSKVVGIDLAQRNLTMACRRALEDKQKYPTDARPYTLFLKGDMTQPLYDQPSPYFAILSGKEPASTPYLEQFAGLTRFDCVSCQFAMHYACESEEVFRQFAQNVAKHCKGTFFGTCSDGASIYALLVGRTNYIFTNGRSIGAEYVKEYEDQPSWTETFGMPIRVSLETVDAPQREYLVPFGKVTEIFAEYGLELVESSLFRELYDRQTAVVLSPEQQTFSFLNRSFVFRRVERPRDPAPPPADESAQPTPAPAPTKRKLKRGGGTPEEAPVLFMGAGEDQGEFRDFSNDAQYPIEIEGVEYPTVEHYYQASKAKLCNDMETHAKILEAKTPKVAKALGRKVAPFLSEQWNDAKQEVMIRALRAKFVQHPALQTKLLDTGTRPIGKADPRNTYWGIGTGVASEKSNTPSKWRGQNQLGKLLMAMRSDFKASA